jgi:hypothetical protein
MHCQSVLEARRTAWKHCSTSSLSQPHVLTTARLSRPAHVPSVHVWTHGRGAAVRCRAQGAEAPEKAAEGLGRTSHGSSNGSKNSSNGSASGHNGNGSSAGEEGGSLGSYDKHEAEKEREKGTLDHLLEQTRQVSSGCWAYWRFISRETARLLTSYYIQCANYKIKDRRLQHASM